jgi:hypothetical protein
MPLPTRPSFSEWENIAKEPWLETFGQNSTTNGAAEDPQLDKDG